MPVLNDREYYVSRAAATRELASRATEPKIAAIHREMAERYERLAEMATHDQRQRAQFVPMQLVAR